MARKYKEVKGYWVYSIKIPSINKYYIGVSHQKCSQRWRKSNYKNNSLAPYLQEWGSMEKTVIKDNLTKEEALKCEDELIQALRLKDLCINSHRSGLIKVSDANAYNRELKKQRYQTDIEYREKTKQYQKQWQKDNNEQKKQYNKQYRENNKEKIQEYNKQYYQKKKLEKQQQTVVP